MARQHRSLRLAGEQQIEPIAVVIGQGLGPETAKPGWIALDEIDYHPGAGGQDHTTFQAGIEQHIPILSRLGHQVIPASQQQHPGTAGPWEGQSG
jgi:hypothetical protein